MATIRKMRDKWQAIVKRSGFPLQSKSFRNKTDARKWAREAESALDNGIVVTGKSIATAPITAVTASTDAPNTINAHDCPTVADMLKRYRDTVAIHHKGHPRSFLFRCFAENAMVFLDCSFRKMLNTL